MVIRSNEYYSDVKLGHDRFSKRNKSLEDQLVVESVELEAPTKSEQAKGDTYLLDGNKMLWPRIEFRRGETMNVLPQSI